MYEEMTSVGISAFFSKFPKLVVKTKTTILRGDQQPKALFFLESGYVKQYSVSPAGEMLMMTIYKPGSCFPLMWALEDIPNTTFLETVSPVVMRKVPKERFLELLHTHPDILFAYAKRIVKGLNGLMKRMELLVFDRANMRVALILSYFARSFGEKAHGSITLPILLPHKELAAWCGLTRETTSVEMARLVKGGVISYNHRFIVIQNLPKLEHASI
ncbi:Crp/Fnr family transcriptional regulator [Candidatus Gottesmanbacteria bacterium]|nr:Crp/Fnr family transcriptional regulator [Candidatus Gottesmanbacteria bacterium]